MGEVLALTWADEDFDAGVVRVRKQLDRHGRRVDPKARSAIREVAIMAALGTVLREHRLRSPFSHDEHFVFCSLTGSPLNARNVARRGLDRATEAAGLNRDGEPKLRFHDLRHGFASMLIAQGGNVAWIAHQLGHASPTTTLNVYAHVFAGEEHAARQRDRLEESFGSILDLSRTGEA
jgi:integrase